MLHPPVLNHNAFLSAPPAVFPSIHSSSSSLLAPIAKPVDASILSSSSIVLWSHFLLRGFPCFTGSEAYCVIFHPAPPGPSKDCIWDANISGSWSLASGSYQISAVPLGFPLRNLRNISRSIVLGFKLLAKRFTYIVVYDFKASCAWAASFWATAVFCCSFSSMASLDRNCAVAAVKDFCSSKFPAVASVARSLACDTLSCKVVFSERWISWSLRLFHQIRMPKTDSPATPITTIAPKISAQSSNWPINVSRASFVTTPSGRG